MFILGFEEVDPIILPAVLCDVYAGTLKNPPFNFDYENRRTVYFRQDR
jgi:hypothetical protein